LRGTIGKEDSVKETQEGCLSRAINDFLNVMAFKKSQAACRKDFFDKLKLLFFDNFCTEQTPGLPSQETGGSISV